MAGETDSREGKHEPDTVSFAASRDGAREPSAAHAPEAGTVVAGKYKVERVLGSGGMGVVVSAMHLELGERVAIKFLATGVEGAAVARFRREAQVAIRIKSEHVARLMDVGTMPSGAPFLVMEYLEGQSLSQRLAARGPLPVAEAVDHLLQAMEAVAEAHRLGVVHRDLKPSNLFLASRADGTPLVKVLDFGIAKLLEGHERSVLSETPQARAASELTAAAVILGSPNYMSPEQVRSARGVDARSDVWSLGVVLYELVTGRLPFDAESPAGVMAAIVADEPAPPRRHRPDLPAAFEEVVLQCLDKDRARRWPDVATLARALSAFSSTERHASVERILRLADGAPRAAAPEGETGSRPAPARSDTGASATAATWSLPHDPKRAARWVVIVGLGAAAALAIWINVRAEREAPANALPEAAPELPAPVVGATIALPTNPAAAPPPESAEPTASATSAVRNARPATSATPRRLSPPSAPSASASAPTPVPSGPKREPDVAKATETRH